MNVLFCQCFTSNFAFVHDPWINGVTLNSFVMKSFMCLPSKTLKPRLRHSSCLTPKRWPPWPCYPQTLIATIISYPSSRRATRVILLTTNIRHNSGKAKILVEKGFSRKLLVILNGLKWQKINRICAKL